MYALLEVSRLSFLGGDGSANNPYHIYYLEDLNDIRNHLTSCFKLIRDLDFLDDASYFNPIQNKPLWTSGQGWTPIASAQGYWFEGELDGNSKVIKNLYINRSDKYYIGLFEGLDYWQTNSGAKIKNLGLENINITTNRTAGGLVCATSGTQGINGEISNCWVTGQIKSNSWAGGLIQYLSEGFKVINSWTDVAIDGYVLVGGFVSQCWFGEIINCYSKGSVLAQHDAGGFIARHEGGHISKCYSLSNVTTTGYISSQTNKRGRAGGFVSYHDGGDIENCYCRGNVFATNTPSIGDEDDAQVGGFVGLKVSTGYIKNCYCTGDVAGLATLKGGFAGDVVNHISIPYPEFCYFYKLPNNQIATYVLESEMKVKSTFLTWDFNNIWAISASINDGFPYFGSIQSNLYVKYNSELKSAKGYVKKNGELVSVTFMKG